MIVTKSTHTIRRAAIAACAFSAIAAATPSHAEPAAESAGSIYTGYSANQNPTPDRSSRSRSQRASQAAFRNAQASADAGSASIGGFGSSSVVSEARRYLGTNPTGRSSLWCATFMNMVLERAGHKTSGSNMARSFASYGRRVSGPQVGAIAVMSRGKRGGHVGVVSGIDANGNPIVISGNHNRRVAEATYPRGRIYAYVMPM